MLFVLVRLRAVCLFRMYLVDVACFLFMCVCVGVVCMCLLTCGYVCFFACVFWFRLLLHVWREMPLCVGCLCL